MTRRTGTGQNDGSIPALIIDILETWFGEWFTIEQITLEVLRLRPDVNPGTVNRMVWKLKAAGHIECVSTNGWAPARFCVEERAYLNETVSA